MNDNTLYIGFDFSINKPAMSILWKDQINFFIWPLSQRKNDLQLFLDNDIYSMPRGLEAISPKKYTASELTKIHTERSKQLADLIVDTLQKFLQDHNISESEEIFIATEGLSYGSSGDATLNLATYKGVLLVKLIENFNVKELYTFSPISMKALAGCSSKEKRNDKNAMIEAFRKDYFKNEHKFHKNIKDFIKKKNYAQGVDDITDSYWVLKKMLQELGKI